MAIFKNKNTSIFYETKGSGPFLVLLAGLASDSQSWSTITGKLTKHFTLILPDNRGCGRTVCPADEITIPAMASDVVALLDHLEVPKTHLLGHSMGGYVAQQICLDEPNRIDRLIVAATSASTNNRNQALLNDLARHLDAGMDLRDWLRLLYYWIFTQRFFENQKILELSLDYSVEYPYLQSAEHFSRQVEALNAFDITDRLHQINNQTLILCGGEDILFTPEESKRVLSAILHSREALIEHAAHALHVEQPDAFVREVAAFLNGR